MQILFVHMTSQMSGVEFSTLYLAEHLDRRYWTPRVICPEEGELSAQCRAHGLSVEFLLLPRFYSTSLRIAARAVPNPLAIVYDIVALVGAARSLASILREKSPALVVTKGLLAHFYGGLAARWVGIPCVWHVQDRVSNRAGPLFAWTLGIAARIFAREIIVDAESIAQQLRPIVAPERLSIILNGVDMQEFSPHVDGTVVRGEWCARPSDLLVGVVGRLTPWKGQHVLVNAFARLAAQFPQARLVLIGSVLFDTDTYARELKADTVRYGIADHVIFAGFRRDMPQVLAALDVVAHTALEKDSSPLAVVSAMAAGKPIVCTRVDGTAQLFDDGRDGLLVLPGDVDALVVQLARLLNDAELRTQLGCAARIKAERWLSVERFAQQCEEVFERATR